MGGLVVAGAAACAVALRWRMLEGFGLDAALTAGDANPLARAPGILPRILTPMWTVSLAWLLEFFPLWMKVDYGYNALPVVETGCFPAKLVECLL